MQWTGQDGMGQDWMGQDGTGRDSHGGAMGPGVVPHHGTSRGTAWTSLGDAMGPRGPRAPPLEVRIVAPKVPWRRLSRSEVWQPLLRSQGDKL